LPCPSFHRFRLFVDEEARSDLNSIYAGTIKVYPITRFNGRIYFVPPENENFGNQLYPDVFMPYE
jgi:hypothetical protein